MSDLNSPQKLAKSQECSPTSYLTFTAKKKKLGPMLLESWLLCRTPWLVLFSTSLVTRFRQKNILLFPQLYISTASGLMSFFTHKMPQVSSMCILYICHSWFPAPSQSASLYICLLMALGSSTGALTKRERACLFLSINSLMARAISLQCSADTSRLHGLFTPA